jgi:hypothetical protein
MKAIVLIILSAVMLLTAEKDLYHFSRGKDYHGRHFKIRYRFCYRLHHIFKIINDNNQKLLSLENGR